MDPSILQPAAATSVWALARRQHAAVTREQLIALGYGPDAVSHRLRRGRLHPTPWRGVYLVGRPDATRLGRWSAALLACGPAAALAGSSAAALDAFGEEHGAIEVSVPAGVVRRRPGIVVHRRADLEPLVTVRHGLRVTTPACTLVDLALRLSTHRLERAIDEADKHDLVDPETLLGQLEELRGLPGAGVLRRVLTRHTFVLTDSELARRFLPIVRQAGLPDPLTEEEVDGFDVDFWWPELGLVVETDGLRYHRTPAAQARDRRRDQAHTAAGRTPLRFTHAQVAFERAYVQRVLGEVAARLKGSGAQKPPDASLEC